MDIPTIVHEQRSGNINGGFPNGKLPDRRVLSNVHRNVVKSPNRHVKDHYDVVSIWRTTYSKWLSAVQLLASEGGTVEMVLAGCLCGEPFTALRYAPFMCKLPRLYNQLVTLHVQGSAVGFVETSSSTRRATFNRHEITKTRNAHVWSLYKLHASMETHFHSRLRLTFGEVSLEINSSCRLYPKSALQRSARWTASVVTCSSPYEVRAVAAAR
jgi:hypothetical protein